MSASSPTSTPSSTPHSSPPPHPDSSGLPTMVLGTIDTPVGPAPRVGTDLTRADRLGAWKARWGVGRMGFAVRPGLYAVGAPTTETPVLVTANYKMTFDRLRRELAGRDLWILVLDTKGINVWCAAGKGTFGTDEIVERVEAVGLSQVVSHRRLILPQLGAPGVAAHEVKNRTGFKVRYGPVRASDLPAFLDAGMRTTPEMRRVTFPLNERVALIPMEIVLAAKWVALAGFCFLLLGGLGPDGLAVERLLQVGLPAVALLLLATLGGGAVVPALLPWLPGRAFATKGFWVGAVLAAATAWWGASHPAACGGPLGLVAWVLIIPAITSFLGMQFTGSSTYTSLSGVRREMRLALPIQLACVVLGAVIWIVGRFV